VLVNSNLNYRRAGEGNAETILFLMKDWGTLKYWDAHGGVEHWFICEVGLFEIFMRSFYDFISSQGTDPR